MNYLGKPLGGKPTKDIFVLLTKSGQASQVILHRSPLGTLQWSLLSLFKVFITLNTMGYQNHELKNYHCRPKVDLTH
jgi:hypothetical protein